MKPIQYIFLSILLSIGCQKETFCPNAGLSGKNCDIEAIPRKMEIRKFSLKKFPEKKANGETWDYISNTGADLTIKLFKDSTEIWASPEVFYEAAAGKTHVFTIAPPAIEVEPTARYRLMVFDFEINLPGGQEWMGGIEFTPYQSGLKFPDTLDFDCPNCSVAFQMEVNYLFN